MSLLDLRLMMCESILTQKIKFFLVKKIFKKAESRQSVILRRMPNLFDILTQDYHIFEGEPVRSAVYTTTKISYYFHQTPTVTAKTLFNQRNPYF